MTQIDISALLRLRDVIGGDAEDVEEFINDFSHIAPELVGKLVSGVEHGDWNAVKISSHTLKSNSRDFGANKLAELCASLEKESAEGEVADAKNKVERISSEMTSAVNTLNNLDLNTI